MRRTRSTIGSDSDFSFRAHAAALLSGLNVVHMRVPDELVALLETDDVGWIVISFVEPQQREDFGGVLE